MYTCIAVHTPYKTTVHNIHHTYTEHTPLNTPYIHPIFAFKRSTPYEQVLIVANIAYAVEFAESGSKATVIGSYFQWMFVGRMLGPILAKVGR